MYEWNGPPQPKTIGFCDLVGTGIAPVSTKTAVESLSLTLALVKSSMCSDFYQRTLGYFSMLIMVNSLKLGCIDFTLLCSGWYIKSQFVQNSSAPTAKFLLIWLNIHKN